MTEEKEDINYLNNVVFFKLRKQLKYYADNKGIFCERKCRECNFYNRKFLSVFFKEKINDERTDKEYTNSHCILDLLVKIIED